MSSSIIKVKEVSKKYRIGAKQKVNKSLSDAFIDIFASPFRRFSKLKSLSSFSTDENEENIIWALKNVSFEVNKGEVLGILGKNGAGKSTLLKILSRITEPTQGKIEIEGRVSSLLEVGTGFHPELTGRENVFLNGTILGMKRKEIEKKFDEIVAFSEVEKFIDTPIKRYSSGMKVRLGFAVAANMEPEILIVDEVLAVGDADFQKRCLGKMQDVANEGRTVLFVSHNLPLMKGLCPRSILLRNGNIVFDGTTEDTINYYLNTSETKTSNYIKFNEQGFDLELAVENYSSENKGVYRLGEDMLFRIKLKSPRNVRNLGCGIGIHHREQCITKLYTYYQYDKIINLKEGETITFDIHWQNNFLRSGLYQLELDVFSGTESIFKLFDILKFEVINTDFYGTGQLPSPEMGIYLSKANWNIDIIS